MAVRLLTRAVRWNERLASNRDRQEADWNFCNSGLALTPVR
jgi:hypothetical protein